MVFLPTHLNSICDSVYNNFLLNYHVEGPFVRVGKTNRDKRGLLSRVEPPTETKGSPFSSGWCYQLGQKSWPFCPGWSYQPGQKVLLFQMVAPSGTKSSCPPAGPASRWTRDKSHFLSRTQRQPGQMAWNKGLFCSSVTVLLVYWSRLNNYIRAGLMEGMNML